MSAVWAEVEPPCTRHDPELFFAGSEPGRPGTDDSRVADAKAVCATCDVQHACLQVALDNGENYGVWGGTTPAERRELLRSDVS